jgi:hypothetical protein
LRHFGNSFGSILHWQSLFRTYNTAQNNPVATDIRVPAINNIDNPTSAAKHPTSTANTAMIPQITPVFTALLACTLLIFSSTFSSLNSLSSLLE